MFKKKVFIYIVILTSLGFGGYYLYQNYFNALDKTPKYITQKASLEDIEDTVTASGILEPKESVEVGAQVSGQIIDIYVGVGDEVEEGQLLAKIDAKVYEAKVDAFKAQLKAQQYQLEDKESQMRLAKLNFERLERLYKQNATSLESVQNGEQAYKTSQTAFEALKAQIEQNESTLKAEQTNLEYATIYAPMSGTVVSVKAKKGQTINANQQTPTILTIANLSTMTIRADVSEFDITSLSEGMVLYFKTMGSEQKWYSKLDKIEPTPKITNNVVLYNALFDTQNLNKKLMISMTAQVFFIRAEQKNALSIPISALEFQKDKTTAKLKVLLKEGKVSERVVKVGIKNRIVAQILSGLKVGEEVITANMEVEKGSKRKSQNNGIGQSSGMPPKGF